jgi:hypothetical protein
LTYYLCYMLHSTLWLALTASVSPLSSRACPQRRKLHLKPTAILRTRLLIARPTGILLVQPSSGTSFSSEQSQWWLGWRCHPHYRLGWSIWPGKTQKACLYCSFSVFLLLMFTVGVSTIIVVRPCRLINDCSSSKTTGRTLRHPQRSPACHDHLYICPCIRCAPAILTCRSRRPCFCSYHSLWAIIPRPARRGSIWVLAHATTFKPVVSRYVFCVPFELQLIGHLSPLVWNTACGFCAQQEWDHRIPLPSWTRRFSPTRYQWSCHWWRLWPRESKNHNVYLLTGSPSWSCRRCCRWGLDRRKTSLALGGVSLFRNMALTISPEIEKVVLVNIHRGCRYSRNWPVLPKRMWMCRLVRFMLSRLMRNLHLGYMPLFSSIKGGNP